MTKRELFGRLREVKLGDLFWVNGTGFRVSEMVSYLDWPSRWFNWVHYQLNGLELALEREGQNVSLWQQVIGVKRVFKKSVHYGGEVYKLDEEESGVAETILRKMENGREISKVAKTPYDIFVAPSGRRLCREVWDGKECWYFSEPGKIEISF